MNADDPTQKKLIERKANHTPNYVGDEPQHVGDEA